MQYSIEIIDLMGKRVSEYERSDQHIYVHGKGVFLVKLTDLEGNSAIRRLIVQ